MKNMQLADRMKFYENFNKQYLAPNQYVLMRLDGKNFSNFTKKNFTKPFDMVFISIMQKVTEYLYNNISGCCAAYMQSDEITLLLTDMKTVGMEGWFNYRVDKMCSIAASMATAKFNNLLYSELFYRIQSEQNVPSSLEYSAGDISEELDKMPLPVFDCRVWNVPNIAEVENVFLWRQRDCIRNSVLQYAQSFFLHKELMNKNIDEVKDLIRNKFINDSSKWWENLFDVIKYGTFYFKRKNVVTGRNEMISFSEPINSPDTITPISFSLKRVFEDVVKY